jgi:predicted Na+-dependent transporter
MDYAVCKICACKESSMKDIALGISLSNSWYGCDYQLKAIALNQFMVWNDNISSNLEAIAYKTISQTHILN